MLTYVEMNILKLEIYILVTCRKTPLVFHLRRSPKQLLEPRRCGGDLAKQFKSSTYGYGSIPIDTFLVG